MIRPSFHGVASAVRQAVSAPLLLFLFQALSGCSPALKEVYACDLYQSGGCTIRPESVYILQVDDRLRDSLKTWTDFSHHLYFHSRVTPGIRVDLRGIGDREHSLLNRAGCGWNLEDPSGRYRPVNGRMEGVRADENGLWCFDYLGTMLLAFVRENGIAAEKADPARIFPLRLRISATTGLLKTEPSIERSINLRLVEETKAPDR